MNRQESLKRIDYWALVLVLLYLIVSLFVADCVINPQEVFPFTDYYLNTGVRAISIIRMMLCITLASGFIWLAVKKSLSHIMFNLLLVLIVILCVLMWFELWWGSTFYYGEVRDKQGLIFPFGSILGLSYVALRIKVPLWYDNQLSWRWLAILVITTLLWVLWEVVRDPWNLYQS